MYDETIKMLVNASLETILMVFASGVIAIMLGLPLGVLLFVTKKGGIYAKPQFSHILSMIINAWRSLPFIILLIAIIPFTRLIVGTSIGTIASIVPLAIAATPFIARLAENTFQEIPDGLFEAGRAMGADTKQIIWRILLPESLPGLINAVTLTFVTLVGYSAMAGVVGGGGLGDLAIQYGYNRFDATIMLLTIIILIVLVQVLQSIGNFIEDCCRRKI